MIQEHQMSDLLRAATDDVAVSPGPGRELAAIGARRRRRRRSVVAGVVSAAVLAVPGGVWVAGQLRGSDGRSAATPSAASCVNPVPSRVLPEWARAGFTEAEPSIPYVLGDHGDIVAILFAQPLSAPQSGDRQNKILWASRYADGSPLRITATLGDGSEPVYREVAGGPGPSTVDLPRPGCWHLTLQWAGRTDSLALAYVAP